MSNPKKTRRRKPATSDAPATTTSSRAKVPFVARQNERLRRAARLLSNAFDALSKVASETWAADAAALVGNAENMAEQARGAMAAAPANFTPAKRKRTKPSPFAVDDQVQVADASREAYKEAFEGVEFGTTAIGKVIAVRAAKPQVLVDFGAFRTYFGTAELVKLEQVDVGVEPSEPDSSGGPAADGQ